MSLATLPGVLRHMCSARSSARARGQCHTQLQNTEKARGYFNDPLDVAADEYQVPLAAILK